MIAEVIIGFAVPPASGLLWTYIFALLLKLPPPGGFRRTFWRNTAFAASGMLTASLMPLHGWWAPWNVPGAGWWLALALWHLNRRRRDRVQAWLGAKSRALRDALVRKARELSQPRLAPVPSARSWSHALNGEVTQ